MDYTYVGGIGFLLFSMFVVIAIAVWIGWLLLIGALVVAALIAMQYLVARVSARLRDRRSV